VKHPCGVEAVEIAEYMGFNLGTAFVALWEGRLAVALQHLERFDKQANPVPRIGPSFFREVMAVKKPIFNRPSPWCESVRFAMACICDLCANPEIKEACRLTARAIQCVKTAIDDDECMGRAMEP
jgi:hypothetical protein